MFVKSVKLNSLDKKRKAVPFSGNELDKLDKKRRLTDSFELNKLDKKRK